MVKMFINRTKIIMPGFAPDGMDVDKNMVIIQKYGPPIATGIVVTIGCLTLYGIWRWMIK